MAKKSSGVWGIEIGQTALKALRCVIQDDEVVADAFDYIEYPKILSQPEAEPEVLIAEALNTLMERNDSVHEMVVISVPGQSGLAKFFKPPPVDVKKLGDIVRYEARQQIPFDLDDVVWDFQMMPGSMIEEGMALDSEVGLFAMKREQSYRQLQPFTDAGIEVDQVQLAPIALYNTITYDRLHERVEADLYDPDNPPPSTVLLSIGTDSSDLIVTNGFRIWQRNMPIGGNHFTRQLTKDLKMTFAKAEHLKRNVREAVDPKLVIQTMRPVFNDLENEIQRSIGFFRSIEKKAEIQDMVITGNTVKMPGLATYLGKNLGFDVQMMDRFNRLGGEDVMSIPAFRDNLPTFAVCYGLCLQGLGVAQIKNSLIPQEIKTERLIRAKKPWTLAALAALLLGMTGHYLLTERSWATTHPDLWSGAESAVSQTKSSSSSHESEDANLEKRLVYIDKIGVEVAGNPKRHYKWLEIRKVIADVIPRTDFPDGNVLGPKERPYTERRDIQVKEVDTRFYDDLTDWWSETMASRYKEEIRSWARLTGNTVTEDELSAITGPTEAGWVIQMKCYHYYNDRDKIGRWGMDHIRRELLNAFLTREIDVVVDFDANGNPVKERFTLEQYGISYPVILREVEPTDVPITNPDYDPADAANFGGNMMGGMADGDGDSDVEPPTLKVPRMDFTFQFVWNERTLEERRELRTADEEAAAKAAEEAAAADGTPLDDTTAMVN